jgi:microcystin-dependent protein
VIILWEGTLAEVDDFDGGSSGTVSDTTGPMWEIVTELNARFPIGAGTLPSTTVIAQGATGGEETHALTVPELPAHTHLNRQFNGQLAAGASAISVPYSSAASSTVTDSPTSSAGTGAAHNNLPPYKAVYFLRRTLRRFYTTS